MRFSARLVRNGQVLHRETGRLCIAAGLLACICFGYTRSSVAQVVTENVMRYTLDTRGEPLTEALDRFVELANINIAIDIDLLEGKTSECRAVDLRVEEMLNCMLEGAGLTFSTLSSGTYVITKKKRVPKWGHITGQVVDEESGEPLIYAHVILADAHVGDVTNEAGRFSFSQLSPGVHRLVVSYIGYENKVDSVQVRIGETTRIALNMRLEPLVTTPIVINGLVPRMPSESLVSDTVSVTSISQSGSGNVLRSVGTVIGVRVGDALADVHVQGGSSGDHQYQLDGAPVFVPIPNGGVVGPFSPFALSNLTVHKAGFGVTHGSSLSGVIEVGHQLTNVSGSRFDVQVDPLSVNTRAMGSIGDVKNYGMNWMVAARKSIWSIYQPPSLSNHFSEWSSPDTYLLHLGASAVAEHAMNKESKGMEYSAIKPEYRDALPASSFQDNFDFHDAHAALRVHLGAHQSVHASFYHGSNELGDEEVMWGRLPIAGAANQERPPSSTEGAVQDLLTMDSRYSWANAVGQVRYEHLLGDRTFAEWGVWYSSFDLTQYMHQEDYDSTSDLAVANYNPDGRRKFGGVPFVPVDSIPYLRSDDENEIAELGFKATFNRSFGSRHYVTAGLESVRSESEFLLGFQNPLSFSGRSYSQAALTAEHWRSTAFLEDTFAFSERTSLKAGVRMTYLNSHQRFYAEPRVAFRHDATSDVLGEWAFRGAFGLYRQFVNQFDIASLGINAVLPGVRFWLPVSSDVNPARSIHASGAFLLKPSPSWNVRVEGYYKWQPHMLVIDYARAAQFSGNTFDSQDDLLIGADGFAYGAAISIERKLEHVNTRIQYEFSEAQQRIPNRFNGDYLTVPWNVPHRITTSFDVALGERLTFIGRLENSIGRAWAFRDAYYDFIEPTGFSGFLEGFDLSDPTEHRLPVITKLDLGISYTQFIKDTRVQIRMDLANLLSNSNVEEWIIESDLTSPDNYNVVGRTLTPFLPSVTIRVGW